DAAPHRREVRRIDAPEAESLGRGHQADHAVAFVQRERLEDGGVEEGPGEDAETQTAGEDHHGQQGEEGGPGQEPGGVADVLPVEHRGLGPESDDGRLDTWDLRLAAVPGFSVERPWHSRRRYRVVAPAGGRGGGRRARPCAPTTPAAASPAVQPSNRLTVQPPNRPTVQPSNRPPPLPPYRP